MEALANLGIDVRSLILYLVNFGLLMVVLTKLLYKPTLKFLDERRETIKKNLEEAETLRKQFAKETISLKEEKEASVREMQQQIAEAKSQGETKAKALLSEAEASRDKMIDDARTIIEEMKGRMEGEVEADVKARIEQIVLTVLKDAPEADVKKSIEAAWAEAKS